MENQGHVELKITWIKARHYLKRKEDGKRCVISVRERVVCGYCQVNVEVEGAGGERCVVSASIGGRKKEGAGDIPLGFTEGR